MKIENQTQHIIWYHNTTQHNTTKPYHIVHSTVTYYIGNAFIKKERICKKSSFSDNRPMYIIMSLRTSVCVLESISLAFKKKILGENGGYILLVQA